MQDKEKEREDFMQKSKQMFDIIDKDHSGGIDKYELQHALLKMGIQIDQESVVDMIKLIDTSSDDILTLDEFRHFLYVCMKSSNDYKSVLFYVADTNYSETIDKQELHIILQKAGLQIQRAEVDVLIEHITQGQGEVSHDQFISIIEAICQ